MSKGIIYRNIFLYRLAMNLLYGFAYKKRFEKLYPFINGKSVNEFCFGDLYMASFCRKNNIAWHGYEFNTAFVRRAIRKGHLASQTDLKHEIIVPVHSDVNMIIGSLYHFHERPENLMNALFADTCRVIISEPVSNIASKSNYWGRLAARVSDAGSGPECYRFNEHFLMKIIDLSCEKYNFTHYKKEYFKKDLIIVLDKCQNPR